jgi:hypothetical protein
MTGKPEYLAAARKVGGLLVEAQNPNGSWSGLYDVARKKGRIADNPTVWHGGEFDDGGVGRPFFGLLLLYHATGDEKYLKPLVRAADWILTAEIVGPRARGWAGFYDADNKPVQARVHEFPKIMTRVFPVSVGPLLTAAYHLTGNRKYIDGMRPALKWYQEHRTADGWAAFYDPDGTPFKPVQYYAAGGMYGPAYGHFRDITDIERAVRQLDRGELKPPTGPVKPSSNARAAARRWATEWLRDVKTAERVRRDVALIPLAEWVPERPRLEPHLYGLQVGGQADIDLILKYVLTVRAAAGRVPDAVLFTGAPLPDGSFLPDRCWFVEDWYATPLREKSKEAR